MFEHLKWAVENRVVRGPVVALFDDEDDAKDFVEGYLDLRVFPASEVGPDGYRRRG